MYDPETSELKVVEAPRVVLRATLRPTDEELEELEGPAEKRNFLDQKKSLGMEFGTKRAKKILASLTENAITKKAGSAGELPSDAVSTAVLEGLAETTASIPTREEQQAAVDAAKPRPKANLRVETPAEVYPLSSLISEDDLKTVWVKDWIDTEESGEQVQGLTSRFVAHRLSGIAARSDSVRNLKILRYIYMLVNFYLALGSGRDGKKTVPKGGDLKATIGAPNTIVETITSKFCDGR